MPHRSHPLISGLLAAGLFGVSLGAQILVGQIGALGLELFQLGLEAIHLIGSVGCHGGLNFFRGCVVQWVRVVVIRHWSRLQKIKDVHSPILGCRAQIFKAGARKTLKTLSWLTVWVKLSSRSAGVPQL